ncbi:Substrate-specific component TrpP of tryptophan ECF transporter [Methanosarcina siciliae HI350]|uniref:Substrate-specific component TrpP of tryptophan ECF transporter n=2 Tax=Methanosarcina siciliae TaxID=38027 RepID=A0A0E3PDJ3_9EURY|nr:Substrate-specific component TrpP of tryptophan ECF transporter [Methanosarcina siciliae HI350]
MILMKSQDIAIVGILLAVGAIVRYLSLVIPGPIVSNLVIAFYCLAIILVVPTFTEVIGIGVVAGIICALLSHSIFPPANLISEPVGAVVCLVTYKSLMNRLSLSPAVATLLGTLASGITFVVVAMLLVTSSILTKYATMGAFVAAIIPIVGLTAIANSFIAQILYVPASKVLARGKA